MGHLCSRHLNTRVHVAATCLPAASSLPVCVQCISMHHICNISVRGGWVTWCPCAASAGTYVLSHPVRSRLFAAWFGDASLQICRQFLHRVRGFRTAETGTSSLCPGYKLPPRCRANTCSRSVAHLPAFSPVSFGAAFHFPQGQIAQRIGFLLFRAMLLVLRLRKLSLTAPLGGRGSVRPTDTRLLPGGRVGRGVVPRAVPPAFVPSMLCFEDERRSLPT